MIGQSLIASGRVPNKKSNLRMNPRFYSGKGVLKLTRCRETSEFVQNILIEEG